MIKDGILDSLVKLKINIDRGRTNDVIVYIKYGSTDRVLDIFVVNPLLIFRAAY